MGLFNLKLDGTVDLHKELGYTGEAPKIEILRFTYEDNYNSLCVTYIVFPTLLKFILLPKISGRRRK